MHFAKTEEQWINFILEKVDKKESGCWEYKVHRHSNGYGVVHTGGRFRSKVTMVHRIIFSHYFGEIPKDKIVCHKCDNRPCCNPEHLYLGTYKDNYKDMLERNRFNNNLFGIFGEKSVGAKFSKETVDKIKQHPGPYSVITNVFNISKSQVSYIKNGKSRKYG